MRCKYCGQGTRGKATYCDPLCGELDRKREREKRNPPRKPHSEAAFHAFAAAQQAARREGRSLSYGQWQAEHGKADIKKEDMEK